MPNEIIREENQQHVLKKAIELCADETMCRHYDPEQLIEVYLKQTYQFIMRKKQ